MGNEQQHRIFWNAGVRREKRRDLHPEKRIHTDEVWMDLEPLFSPGLRVLDAGGGCGRYSILIAKKGCQVTHLDLSSGMLQEARKQAEREGVRGITFGEGKVQDLSAFSDQSFDVVLSLDAPVSYASPFHKKALQELCRVCQDKLAVSVVSRLGQLPVILRMEIQWRKSVEFSRHFFSSGQWDHPGWMESTEKRMPFLSRFIFPPLHAFFPREIHDLVQEQGFRVTQFSATGSLARLLPRKVLQKVIREEILYRDFLQLAREYDAQFEVLGLGAQSASGLFILAERNPHESDLDQTDHPSQTGR